MSKRDKTFLLAFAILSAMTIGLGAWTMAQAGIPAGIWLRNPAAWVVGAGLALLVVRFPPPRLAVLGVAAALLAVTFVMPGQYGVHRWIGLGPVQLNVAALVLPMVVISLRADRISLAVSLVIAALLYLQPDASQAFAFAAALLAFLLTGTKKWWPNLFGLPFVAALQSWDNKHGLLPPVAHVEGIIGMARAQAPVAAVGMVVLLASVAMLPSLSLRSPDTRYPAAALTLYFGVSAAAVVTGYFPVPLAGYGISFVIGWWLGIGLLLGKKPDETVEA